MPSLSRLFPTSRPTHGEDGDRIRADYLDASLVPVIRERDNSSEQSTSLGPQSTVQGSYHLHGMALPQASESKRRTDSVKRREKTLPSRSHSRSFSQFFGGSKKKFLGIDSDTDSSEEDGFGTSNTGPSSASKGKRALSARDGEPSFETGTCMTCNSKVRWPKGLKLYRCTVCHCVNDLEPRNSEDLHKVKEVDQATWRKINTRYPGLKFPDAPCFALAAREARDIADRCMFAYAEAVHSPSEPHAASREARRPSADANANATLSIRRKPVPINGNRRPSAGALPPLPSPSPLLTPPHLTDINNPFNNYELYSSPENSASPRKLLPRQTDHTGRAESAPSPQRSLPPPAPERKPPPPPKPASSPGKALRVPSAPPKHARGPSVESYVDNVSRSQGPSSAERLKAAFTPLEVYLKWSYASFESINNAFSTVRRQTMTRAKSDGPCTASSHEGAANLHPSDVPADQAWYLSEIDGKTLLVGDVAENATLWTGAANGGSGQRKANARTFSGRGSTRLVTHRSPCIDWQAAREWYHAVLEAGQRWQQKHTTSDLDTASVEVYLQKLLFRATESLLRRPGRLLNEPEDIRFLMVMLANPLFHRQSGDQGAVDRPPSICKKILGLLARSGKRALRYLDGWLVNLDNDFYSDLLSLCKRYMHYRLLRDIVPDEGKRDIWSPEARPGQETNSKSAQKASANIDDDTEARLSYFDDWGLSSAAAFMFSLWNANLSRPVRLPCNSWYNLFFDSMGEAAIKQDFTAWESRKPAFAFCYFPFLISMSAKITILTFDANRQQMDEARKAWHQQFNTAAVVSQNLHVEVRRECLANDSLRSISEAAGSASHHKELKKGLRIHFKGEEGVDAGGLRKEFFLLLLRELLDPNHGLVEYDEQSNYCYFNPISFEDSAQYSLLGTLVGLAIYNGTILDIPFPPLLFKKLLRRDNASSHSDGEGSVGNSSALEPSLDDLAQWRPSLARGFRQLLEYDGNVEEDLALTFSIEIDRYGSRTSIPLAGKPADTPVTSENRSQYVRSYMQYLMHDSVSRQFEPFKLGFFAVCGGNALSLFQPEELELLVRGSDEALDVDVLRAVAVYEGWTIPEPAESVPVIRWFWEFFASLGHKDQRKLLGFITGSDRVPALGEANLTIKLQYAGPEKDRLPVARTCFNALQLYPYDAEKTLREKLWRAVTESEGFLLK